MAIIGAIAVPHPPLIVPAVGRGREKCIQETIDAYELAVRRLLDAEPDVLVVTSPHAPLFRDGFHVTTDGQLRGSMRDFRAPREVITARCDVELAQMVLEEAAKADIPAVNSDFYRDDMDHATFVPLYFMREEWKRRRFGTSSDDLPCPIVRIGLSGLPFETHREMGACIARAAVKLGRRVGFVASGDLSHKLLESGPYGFAPEGPVFDARIGELFAKGDLNGLFELDEDFCDAAAECGLRSFMLMAGALDSVGFQAELLSNEGPFGVGYGVATFMPEEEYRGSAAVAEPDDAAEAIDPHVRLARLSVETYVRTGASASLPADVPVDLLERRAGVFVSLHKHGDLRGCIGTIGPTTECIAQEILQNGISACSRDPRFDPVRPDELDYLEYSVDVLGDAEPIASPDELDPKRYGVIVTKGWRRGLLLPNLEGVDTVDYQLAIAKQKAGIDPRDSRVNLERFEVVRHTAGGKARVE